QRPETRQPVRPGHRDGHPGRRRRGAGGRRRRAVLPGRARPRRPSAPGARRADGRLRAVGGVLPSVLSAAKQGDDVTVVVPAANGAEAALVPGVRVVPAPDLRRLVEWLRAGEFPPCPSPDPGPSPSGYPGGGFGESGRTGRA